VLRLSRRAQVWWAWGAYAWLTNAIDLDRPTARVALFAAMAAVLVAAMAVPEAFGSDGVLFGVAYFAVRVLHIVLYAAGSPDVDMRQAVLRLARTAIPAPALLIVAGFLDGPAQVGLWVAALALDYAGPYIVELRGFAISPEYFAERFGLVVIIALGESIVALGIGASGLELGTEIVVTAVLGLALAAVLWWAYFDIVQQVALRKLVEAVGHERTLLARDSYSVLHLPIVAGIVLAAFGVEEAIAHPDEPLELVPAAALCGGVALYFVAHLAIRFRSVRTINRRRAVAAAASLALLPVAVRVDGPVALALVTAVAAALVAYETPRFRDRG
jgi:low temperature requirement protein LtrA